MELLQHEFGVIIEGEFYKLKIDELPTQIIDRDPPYVGHPRQSKKVLFNDYSDGQMLVISKNMRINKISKIGSVPVNILEELRGKLTT